MLSMFFAANCLNSLARQYTYQEFPQDFVWHKREKVWANQQKGHAIGRIYFISPAAGEQFYLQTLLTTVKGPLGFEDLCMFNGICYPTFYATCLARGLLQDNDEWHDCLLEASTMRSGDGLCHLFTVILKHCNPSWPNVLWDEFRDSLCDDLPCRFERSALPMPPMELLFDYGLFLLNQILCKHSTSLSSFPSMPLPQRNWDRLDNNPFISEQMDYNIEHENCYANQYVLSLNVKQLASFNAILDSTSRQDGKLFFVDGPGRTGKMFVYNTLCHRIHANGWIVLCVASSGIATLLLPGGQTAHSTFSIPTQNLADDSSCNIEKDSKCADMLRLVRLIIWDKAAMQHRFISPPTSIQEVHNGICPIQVCH
jgi:PIF1-like helicase